MILEPTLCSSHLPFAAPTRPAPSAQAPLPPADRFHPSEPAMHEVVARLPKIDLHRHLEGSISPESFLELADKYGIALPTRDLEQLRPYLQITPEDKTLLDFLKKFDTIGLAFVSKDACRDVTEAVVHDAAKDNVKYLELRFSPMYMAAQKNLPLEDVMDAVVEGSQNASAATGTKVKLIVIVERQMGPEKAKIVERLAEKYKDKGVVALDLANDEFHYPPGPYAEVFQQAKAAGLKVTVHAGEAGGADNVRTSIEKLGADRIGHGVRTQEDPAVEKLVLDRKVPLEFNPTSNMQTGAAKGWSDYPLKRYFVEGIPVTINTDDPAVSGITLGHEYETALEHCGLTLPDLEKVILNGVDAAFLPSGEKQALKAQFERQIAEVEAWRVSGER
jgi:adenosine deaminase